MNWYDKLSLAKHCDQREEIAADPNCIEPVLEILIKEDVEETVIKAGIENPNCPDYLKIIGQNRLKDIETRKQQGNSSICPIPWTHIGIQQNGDYRICCQAIYKPFGKLSNGDSNLNIKNTDISEARNHPLYKSIRLQMLKNQKPKMCELCYKEEKNGLNSKRMFMLKKYKVADYANNTNEDGSIDTQKFPLKYIDIRFGNLCNLKCRYCGPGDSSLWYEDYVEHHGTNVINYYGNFNYKLEKNNNKWSLNSLDFEWYEGEKFWESISELLPYIDRYYFTGGEPTINKVHYNLIQLIIDKGHSSNVVLEYNSNMVAIPDKLYEQWQHFAGVEIGCSIDGINEYANYLRYPSKWEEVEKNLDYLGNNQNKKLQAGIATTINVYNVLHFLDMCKWLMSKNYSRIKPVPSYHVLEGPSHMSVQVLPKETKDLIKEEYQKFFIELENNNGQKIANVYKNSLSGILNYMFAEDKSHLLPRLAVETKKLDEIRNQKLSDIVPWLDQILINY